MEILLITLFIITIFIILYIIVNKLFTNNPIQQQIITTKPKIIESNKTCLCGYQSICPSQEGICSNLCIGADDCDD